MGPKEPLNLVKQKKDNHLNKIIIRILSGESKIKTMRRNPLKNLEVQEKTMTLMEMRTTENTEKYDAINRLMCVNRK